MKSLEACIVFTIDTGRTSSLCRSSGLDAQNVIFVNSFWQTADLKSFSQETSQSSPRLTDECIKYRLAVDSNGFRFNKPDQAPAVGHFGTDDNWPYEAEDRTVLMERNDDVNDFTNSLDIATVNTYCLRMDAWCAGLLSSVLIVSDNFASSFLRYVCAHGRRQKTVTDCLTSVVSTEFSTSSFSKNIVVIQMSFPSELWLDYLWYDLFVSFEYMCT